MNTVQKIYTANNIRIDTYENRFHDGNLPIACVIDTPVKRKTEYFISREEVDAVLEYFLRKGCYQQAAYIIFELNTGFRVGDCLSLRVCDMMEVDRPLQIKQQLTIIEGKTRRYNKYRTVYFNQAVMEVLHYLIKIRRKRECDYLFVPDNRAVFDTEHMVYKPMTRQGAWNMIDKAVKELGIDMNAGSHSLRKTFDYFISMDSEQHVNMDLACKALGHSDERITRKHYLNTPERVLKARMLALNLGLEVWKRYVK